ncbi:hypothetical protein [Paracoccus sp. (in: a-proteobacteria)]|uniref:hypothetical protein n=1 Tax=Paracoccus sp. TaxID=267 RepID=UPI0026DFFB66|nr:hypothetical protein [Paracoccus sp. (in: a-proteobacteria)]MDO5369476.1 hypothetical protein [Paracoccus sp. (in: a-proteobacteria)]
MTYLKPALALAAAMSLSACQPAPTTTTVSVPGAEPVVIVDAPAVGPAIDTVSSATQGSNSLDGSWNLVASQCGDPASQGRLTIEGYRFNFPTAECIATRSEAQAASTSVALGCTGASNRQLELSLRPGVMRMTEGETTLTYYRCT